MRDVVSVVVDDVPPILDDVPSLRGVVSKGRKDGERLRAIEPRAARTRGGPGDDQELERQDDPPYPDTADLGVSGETRKVSVLRSTTCPRSETRRNGVKCSDVSRASCLRTDSGESR
jgi:hypothetical protein